MLRWNPEYKATAPPPLPAFTAKDTDRCRGGEIIINVSDSSGYLFRVELFRSIFTCKLLLYLDIWLIFEHLDGMMLHSKPRTFISLFEAVFDVRS